MSNLKTQIDGSFVVLFEDQTEQEVFLVYRTDYPIWVLTGGGIEPKESPQQAAIRETFEETGFQVKSVKFLGEYHYPRPDQTHRTTYLFKGYYSSGIYQPEFPGNIGRWFPINKLPPDITNSTKRKLTDSLQTSHLPFVKVIDNELPLTKNLHLLLRHPLSGSKFIYRKFF